MTIQCFILEDQAPARRVIENYVGRINNLEIVGSSAISSEARAVISSQTLDILFLDLNLPQIDGFEFLESLENPPAVIVTTAYPSRALEGFEHGVADYLVKPFSFDRFRKAVNRALIAKQSTEGDRLIEVPCERAQKSFVKLGDIISISADGDYISIKTRDRNLHTLGPLTKWEEKLPAPLFARIHRSYLVNISFVTDLSSKAVLLGDESLPVGATYLDQLKESVASFIKLRNQKIDSSTAQYF